MKENYFVFKQSEMMKYVQMNRELDDSVEWGKILSLGERELICFIQVVDDNENSLAIAFQGLQWRDQNNELQLQKLEVKEAFQKSGIGTTILKMVIAIGYFYGATKITGVVAGKPFLWDWYPKFGFTIHDENKLLMELRSSS